MKKLTIKKIITLLLCGVIFLSGCAASESVLSFEAMDTFMQLKIYGDESAAENVKNEILRLDSLLSATDENSAVAALNTNGESRSAELAALTRKTLELCESTDGALDISVYPVVEEWGFISRNYKIPSAERLSELLQRVDYSKISAENELVKIEKGMKLGFGAVAKGYAADKALEIMKSDGVKSAILNLGGTVCAHGEKSGGSPWRVGIASPDGEADYCAYVECRDKIIATSGSYERYFTGDDGKTYCHILDPKTGYPADNGLLSVTIISDSGLKSDALSTALFVMGKEKAAEYWRQNGDFEFILLTDSGRAFVSRGAFDSFTLAAGSDFEVEKIE